LPRKEYVTLHYEDAPDETRLRVVRARLDGSEFINLTTRLGKYTTVPVYRVDGRAHARIIGGKRRF
jgi:hypothetical protein